MKKYFIIAIICLSSIFASSCHNPEELVSNVQRDGIYSIVGSFLNDSSSDNNFTSEIDFTNNVVKIVFPYNYPVLSDNVLPQEKLTQVKLKANLENNVRIEPPLLIFDLTKENWITVKDEAARTSRKFKVIAEIRKSNLCSLTQFSIPSLGLPGIINEDTKTISLVYVGEIGEQLAELSLSHGATIRPDPRTEIIDYDNNPSFTVIAQNGTDNTVYNVVKSIPEKTDAGIRQDSGKLLWVKKLSELQGVVNPAYVTGLAATEKYIVLNERGNSNSVYLDNKTGTVAGTIDISEFSGTNTNYHATSDDRGNILFCNYTPAGGNKFTVWKTSSIDEKPQKYIEYAVENTQVRYGWEISIQGNLDGNALITTPVFYKDGNTIQFARWQVVDGALLSQTPQFVVINASLANANWTKWADVIYSDGSDINSDYFLANYCKDAAGLRYFYWLSGKDNTVISTAPGAPSNTVINSADYIEFNKSAYVLFNYVNSFTWSVKTSDAVCLYEANGQAFGNKIHVCDPKIYGALDNGAKNTDGTADVLFHQSGDGYFLYVYFLFSNGCIGCVQFDCIKK